MKDAGEVILDRLIQHKESEPSFVRWLVGEWLITQIRSNSSSPQGIEDAISIVRNIYSLGSESLSSECHMFVNSLLEFIGRLHEDGLIDYILTFESSSCNIEGLSPLQSYVIEVLGKFPKLFKYYLGIAHSLDESDQFIENIRRFYFASVCLKGRGGREYHNLEQELGNMSSTKDCEEEEVKYLESVMCKLYDIVNIVMVSPNNSGLYEYYKIIATDLAVIASSSLNLFLSEKCRVVYDKLIEYEESETKFASISHVPFIESIIARLQYMLRNVPEIDRYYMIESCFEKGQFPLWPRNFWSDVGKRSVDLETSSDIVSPNSTRFKDICRYIMLDMYAYYLVCFVNREHRALMMTHKEILSQELQEMWDATPINGCSSENKWSVLGLFLLKRNVMYVCGSFVDFLVKCGVCVSFEHVKHIGISADRLTRLSILDIESISDMVRGGRFQGDLSQLIVLISTLGTDIFVKVVHGLEKEEEEEEEEEEKGTEKDHVQVCQNVVKSISPNLSQLHIAFLKKIALMIPKLNEKFESLKQDPKIRSLFLEFPQLVRIWMTLFYKCVGMFLESLDTSVPNSYISLIANSLLQDIQKHYYLPTTWTSKSLFSLSNVISGDASMTSRTRVQFPQQNILRKCKKCGVLTSSSGCDAKPSASECPTASLAFGTTCPTQGCGESTLSFLKLGDLHRENRILALATLSDTGFIEEWDGVSSVLEDVKHARASMPFQITTVAHQIIHFLCNLILFVKATASIDEAKPDCGISEALPDYYYKISMASLALSLKYGSISIKDLEERILPDSLCELNKRRMGSLSKSLEDKRRIESEFVKMIDKVLDAPISADITPKLMTPSVSRVNKHFEKNIKSIFRKEIPQYSRPNFFSIDPKDSNITGSLPDVISAKQIISKMNSEVDVLPRDSSIFRSILKDEKAKEVEEEEEDVEIDEDCMIAGVKSNGRSGYHQDTFIRSEQMLHWLLVMIQVVRKFISSERSAPKKLHLHADITPKLMTPSVSRVNKHFEKNIKSIFRKEIPQYSRPNFFSIDPKDSNITGSLPDVISAKQIISKMNSEVDVLPRDSSIFRSILKDEKAKEVEEEEEDVEIDEDCMIAGVKSNGRSGYHQDTFIRSEQMLHWLLVMIQVVRKFISSERSSPKKLHLQYLWSSSNMMRTNMIFRGYCGYESVCAVNSLWFELSPEVPIYPLLFLSVDPDKDPYFDEVDKCANWFSHKIEFLCQHHNVFCDNLGSSSSSISLDSMISSQRFVLPTEGFLFSASPSVLRKDGHISFDFSLTQSLFKFMYSGVSKIDIEHSRKHITDIIPEISSQYVVERQLLEYCIRERKNRMKHCDSYRELLDHVENSDLSYVLADIFKWCIMFQSISSHLPVSTDINIIGEKRLNEEFTFLSKIRTKPIPIQHISTLFFACLMSVSCESLSDYCSNRLLGLEFLMPKGAPSFRNETLEQSLRAVESEDLALEIIIYFKWLMISGFIDVFSAKGYLPLNMYFLSEDCFEKEYMETLDKIQITKIDLREFLVGLEKKFVLKH
ncbi:hypothetical protein ADUPG1_011908 [Aduncisulcus paluster]|uniref:Uncharacterized protein n=1 Tax=Aduncisulcus paluster TaxID=2918883 RepID=A0ABQ5JXP4_9EUKA|nr:hypothetical protein ADUPG1_011908 [Aduncisulcus paluster]